VNVAAGIPARPADVPYPSGVTFCVHAGRRVTDGAAFTL
jgi:hypothetical protein